MWIALSDPAVRYPSDKTPPPLRDSGKQHCTRAFHPITTIQGLFLLWWVSINSRVHLFRHLDEEPREVGYVYLQSL